LKRKQFEIFKNKSNTPILHTRFAKGRHASINISLYDDFHYDLKMRLNCIYYLTDVTEVDGPFEYIENSSRIPYSILLKAINLYVFNDLAIFKKEQMDILPLEFRGSLRCGEFIDPFKLKQLEPFRKKIIGGKRTCIIFNSHLLIHKGGTPSAGKRAILFIYLK